MGNLTQAVAKQLVEGHGPFTYMPEDGFKVDLGAIMSNLYSGPKATVALWNDIPIKPFQIGTVSKARRGKIRKYTNRRKRREKKRRQRNFNPIPAIKPFHVAVVNQMCDDGPTPMDWEPL